MKTRLKTISAHLFFVGGAILCAAALALPTALAQDQRVEQRVFRDTLDELLPVADNKGSVRVVVTLKMNSWVADGKLTREQSRSQRSAIRRLQDRVEEYVQKRSPASKISWRGKYTPVQVWKVDAAGVKALFDATEVKNIHEEQLARSMLDQSVPLINGNDAWDLGFNGWGQNVAMIDLGFDSYHPFLWDKMRAEACYSASLCPYGNEQGEYWGAGEPCEIYPDCAHGTAMAGIIGGDLSYYFSGVAPGTELLSVMVGSTVPELPPDVVVVREEEHLLALDQVYTWSYDYPIASAYIGQGYVGPGYDHCDFAFPAIKAAVDNLLSVEVVPVSGAGNLGQSDIIVPLACVSGVVSVGATTKSDQVWPNSNSAYFLDLLAPGENICSARLWRDPDYSRASGTSQASAHVAGAFAVLREADWNATVEQMLNALKSSGVPIYDSRNGLLKPRIDVLAAILDTGIHGTDKEKRARVAVPNGTQSECEMITRVAQKQKRD